MHIGVDKICDIPILEGKQLTTNPSAQPAIGKKAF